MKTAKHTLGPWLAPQEITDNYVWATKNNTSVVVAKVNVQPSTNPMVVISDAEAMFNAKLIAASPELLDELERAHVIIKCMLQEIPQEAKSVLAKYLIRQGISNEGMTRANERETIIAKAKGL